VAAQAMTVGTMIHKAGTCLPNGRTISEFSGRFGQQKHQALE
jgi:hypothetical protein